VPEGPSGARQQAESAGPAFEPSALAGRFSDTVLDAVAWVRARTTLRVLSALRALVYGAVAVAALLTAVALGLIGVVRMWDVYLPLQPVGRRVWLGYVVLGGALFLAGALLLARRTKRKA